MSNGKCFKCDISLLVYEICHICQIYLSVTLLRLSTKLFDFLKNIVVTFSDINYLDVIDLITTLLLDRFRNYKTGLKLQCCNGFIFF